MNSYHLGLDSHNIDLRVEFPFAGRRESHTSFPLHVKLRYNAYDPAFVPLPELIGQ
tara:strand:+ start:66911 stop:67078 length:168 start_codon:yes stop_codon:yes gene_type:complete